MVRDVDSATGTFVNDERVQTPRVLHAGDRLRIGRLEFEVLIDDPAAESRRTSALEDEPPDEAVGESVCALLVEADEEERLRRLKDPELRYLHVEKTASHSAGTDGPAADQQTPGKKQAKGKHKKKKRTSKKAPGKLPPRPKITGKDSTEAAEESLRRLLGLR